MKNGQDQESSRRRKIDDDAKFLTRSDCKSNLINTLHFLQIPSEAYSSFKMKVWREIVANSRLSQLG